MEISYYIKHPGGRMKLAPTPKNDVDAIQAFRAHWTARKTYSCKGHRVLVKEAREDILSEDVKS